MGHPATPSERGWHLQRPTGAAVGHAGPLGVDAQSSTDFIGTHCVEDLPPSRFEAYMFLLPQWKTQSKRGR